MCIGESEAENEAGKTEEVCARQIDAVINLLGVEAFNGAVIAYEPIWAIGTGKSATPAQAQAVHAFIRGHIAKKSQAVADQVIINTAVLLTMLTRQNCSPNRILTVH